MTTEPVPVWPGEFVGLPEIGDVFVRSACALSGNAQPAVFVHGLGGASTNWTDLMDVLRRPAAGGSKPDLPALDGTAIDLPGFGYSPVPADGDYSVTGRARAVIGLIEQRHSWPVHLVGNSLGGAVCTRVAALRPDLIRTLTLISPALPDRKFRGSVAHFPVLALPFLGEWIIRHYTARYPVENRVSGVFATCFYDPARVHPDRFALEVEALRRRDELSYEATSLARAARTLVLETLRPRTWSLWREAGEVTAPSLVVFGSHDRLVDPRLSARAASTFHDALVAVLPETGHLAQMESPGLVATLFRERVEETRARGAANSEATRVPG